jgi:drug/metabolite transporter (DMT)-like permease
METMSPFVAGTAVALLAAICFGVTAPFVQLLGRGVGPFATAGLLYLGAALGSLRLGRRRGRRAEPPVRRAHLGRLAAVALLGAALAPTLFAWGLQRVPATTASLLLNAEAIFTLGLAVLIQREHVGRRALLAAAVICCAGVLAVGGAPRSAGALVGAAAIVGAVLAWALG